MSFDFEFAYLVHNNLGGLGPDASSNPASIRFANVGVVYHPIMGAIHFDIELSNRSAYEPDDPSVNGHTSGGFAQMNLACNKHVDIRATLVRSCATEPSCRICTDSGFSPEMRIACFAAGCSCYGKTVTNEASCSAGVQ